MGFSFQRPDKRAIETDPEAMRAWVEESYPALRERTRTEGAVVLFGDQVGVRSDQLSGRTWGRKGQTPTVARAGNRFGLSAMSTISTRGELRVFFHRVQKLPDRVLGYFQAPHTKYASSNFLLSRKLGYIAASVAEPSWSAVLRTRPPIELESLPTVC
jgi:hypothetical protein